MLKRILLSLVLATSVGGALAACNNASTPSPTESAPAVSSPAESAPAASAPAASSPAASKTYTVHAGDTLSSIAQRELGDAKKYMKIFEANRDQLQDPDKIKPGQVLKIPA